MRNSPRVNYEATSFLDLYKRFAQLFGILSTRTFADDTTLTGSVKSISQAEVVLNVDLRNIKEWLSANKLSLNRVKIEYLLIGSRYNINSLLEEPKLSPKPITRARVTKALGVHIDEFLSWDKHIDNISKKIYSGIGAIKVFTQQGWI